MSYVSRSRQTSSSWFYSSDKVKYHGLWNQGSTCYLNSVLQVLFMTKEFRENLKVPRHRNEDRNIIDRELIELFGELKKYTSGTREITRKLEISNVREQRDAAEYFERILRLTSEQASKVFHGELINRNTCSTCETNTDISAAFWYLPLPLVDSYGDYSVLKGVEDFFRPSELSGENQMYCERCGHKSDATIKCVLERHPEVLVLLLKRFDFNIDYMTYVKINCAVDVPLSLQIPQDQTYELFAFVDHFGSLKSGHYTTTVKSQDDDKWYMFDDSRVSQCRYQWFQVDSNEKLRTAYLLFYRKRKVESAGTSSQDTGVVSAPGVQQVDVSRKKDGLETEDPPTDGDVNAAATVSTKDVGGLKRPAAPPEPPFNRDNDVDRDEDRGHTHVKKQKETTPNDQRRANAAEGVKNEGVGDRSDLQNVPDTHNFRPYVGENQTRGGKPGDIRDGTWIEMDEKKRNKAEHQKNEEFHHVTDQNRQKVDPHPVIVQMPSEDEETNSAGNFVDTSTAQVELNPEPIRGDVSINISRDYREQKVRDMNRDYGEGGDDQKRPERLDNVRDNQKESKRQECEPKPGYDLQKTHEETTGTGDSGTERAEMCTKETGKGSKKSDLHEWNSRKEGTSDSNRRSQDQGEDRKDVGVGDGPRNSSSSSTGSLKCYGMVHKDDKKRPERLDNVHDNLKERGRQECEPKPGYDLQKTHEETTGTGDSGTERAEMSRGGMRESGKRWTKYDLCNQNRTSNERNSPKEGSSDSNRRDGYQREDRKDVEGVSDGPRSSSPSSTGSLKCYSMVHKDDKKRSDRLDNVHDNLKERGRQEYEPKPGYEETTETGDSGTRNQNNQSRTSNERNIPKEGNSDSNRRDGYQREDRKNVEGVSDGPRSSSPSSTGSLKCYSMVHKDDKKRSDRLDDARDNLKERRRQEHEPKPGYDLQKAEEETTETGDSGTRNQNNQSRTSNERNSPKEGTSDSSRRSEYQREDREDVGVGDGPRSSSSSSTGSLKYCDTVRKDDKKRSERLGNVRDNLKERGRQEHEPKPGYEETTETGDSGSRNQNNQSRTSNERNSPKEGISDSSRRFGDQREDRKDVEGVSDGPRRRSSTVSLKYTIYEGHEEIQVYEVDKSKEGDLNDRKGCEKLNTKDKSEMKRLDEDEQRSRGHERNRRRSDRETSSRRENPGRNRSPEQRFSPTQTEAELHLKGGSAGKERCETQGRPPADDATEGRRRFKSESEIQNNVNNHRVRPETPPDAQDALNEDMKKLSVTGKPLKRIKEVELETNGENQTKKKRKTNTFPLNCLQCQKSQTDSE